MKALLAILTIATLFAPPRARAADTDLPPVRETFSKMRPGVVAGQTLREIIPVENVKLIALVENRGKGSPLSKIFKPDWNSDELIKRAFASNAKAREWGMSATESTLARYAIVTQKGELLMLDVLGDMLRSIPVTAIILRGDGFGCRFDIKEDQRGPNNAIDSDKK